MCVPIKCLCIPAQMRDPGLFMALETDFSHTQIGSGPIRADATLHPGSSPLPHTWFEFIGFSSFHLYCVRIVE